MGWFSSIVRAIVPGVSIANTIAKAVLPKPKAPPGAPAAVAPSPVAPVPAKDILAPSPVAPSPTAPEVDKASQAALAEANKRKGRKGTTMREARDILLGDITSSTGSYDGAGVVGAFPLTIR